MKCSTCGTDRPPLDFRFQPQLGRRRLQCKHCDNERRRGFRRAHPHEVLEREQVREQRRRSKTKEFVYGKLCSECNLWKPADCFCARGRTADGLDGMCKPCRARYLHEWKQGRANLHRETRRRNYGLRAAQSRRATVTEKTCVDCGERKPANEFVAHPYNADRLANTCKPCTLVRRRNARRKNPAVYVAIRYRRDRRLKAAGGKNHTTAEWLSLCEEYGNRCACCGAEGALQADHVIPVSKGGCNAITNIQPLCAGCNLHKGARMIDYRREAAA